MTWRLHPNKRIDAEILRLAGAIAGAAGPAGVAGSVGEAGGIGAIGNAGTPGAVGSQGSIGVAGSAGPAGSIGVAGSAGPAGSIGVAGSAGPAGSIGVAGAAGPIGASPIGATGATGISSLHVADNSWWADTNTATAGGTPPNTFIFHEPFADVSFTTSDTSIDVTYVGTSTAYTTFGVYVGGDFYAAYLGTGDGIARTITVSLPPGAKTVTIVEGPSSAGQTFIQSIRGAITLLPVTAPAARMVYYGDSISQGRQGAAGIINMTRDAPPARLRKYAPGRVTSYGSGGLTFNANAGNAGLRGTFVAKVAAMLDGTTSNIFVSAIGTNDWGSITGNVWTAAAFKTALAAFVSDLLVAKPTVIIYLMTMLDREFGATANALGDNLEAYRVAVRQVVSEAANAQVRLIEASAWISQLPDTADGTHPTAAAYARIADNLRAAIWGQLQGHVVAQPVISGVVSVASTFAPGDLAGLQELLTADAGITSDGGTPDQISTWAASGGALSGSWTEATLKPEKTTTGGKPSVLFVSANTDRLRSTLTAAQWKFMHGAGAGAGFTGAWCVKQNSTAATQYIISDITSSTARNGLTIRILSGREINLWLGNSSGTFAVNLTTASNAVPAAGTKFVLDFAFDATGYELRVNKAIVSSGALVGAISSGNPTNTCDLGRFFGSTGYFDGHMFGHALYDRRHIATDRDLLVDWLSAKGA